MSLGVSGISLIYLDFSYTESIIICFIYYDSIKGNYVGEQYLIWWEQAERSVTLASSELPLSLNSHQVSKLT